jgi:glycosyltransferase involved in cell wall biosynthesis
MSELKICVYAISKNEEQFINRFYECAKDADMILLADTGSTDGTVDLAKELGINVYNISVIPWRFDLARNTALSLIPGDYDVCVSLDLDEKLTPGWRAEIERIWVKNETTIMRYIEEVSPGEKMRYEKIHSRHGYYWDNICHELLTKDPRLKINAVESDETLVIHTPDLSKPRTFYVDMLKADSLRCPKDARKVLMLARELHHFGNLEEAITEFDRYLDMPDDKIEHDTAFAYRMVAKSMDKLGFTDEAIKAARKATHEVPYYRESWLDLAELCVKHSMYNEAFYAATTALSITERNHWYTCDKMAYGFKLYDLAAVAAWNLGIKEKALEYGLKAVELEPEDQHLKDNLKFYQGDK